MWLFATKTIRSTIINFAVSVPPAAAGHRKRTRTRTKAKRSYRSRERRLSYLVSHSAQSVYVVRAYYYPCTGTACEEDQQGKVDVTFFSKKKLYFFPARSIWPGTECFSSRIGCASKGVVSQLASIVSVCRRRQWWKSWVLRHWLKHLPQCPEQNSRELREVLSRYTY